MKKSLLTLGLTLALILSADRVFSQGSWYIGGVVGYGSNTYNPDAGDERTTTTWAFGPEVGTFPKENLQLGFILGLNGSTEKQADSERTTSYFSPTVYLRKFKPVSDALSIFGGVYLNYSSGKVDNEGDETTGSGVGVNLGVGVAYALSPRFTAVGQYGVLGFSSATYKLNGDEYAKRSDFNFGVNTVGASSFIQGNGSGSAFNIGVYYTFKTAD